MRIITVLSLFLLKGFFVRCQDTSTAVALNASSTVQQRSVSNSLFVSTSVSQEFNQQFIISTTNATLAVQPSSITTAQVQQTQNVETTISASTTLNPLLADLHQKALDLLINITKDSPTKKATTFSYCETVEWDDSRRQCSDDSCVKKYIEEEAKRLSCLESKPANVTVSTIFDKMKSAGLVLASGIQQNLASGQSLNGTETRVLHSTLVSNDIKIIPLDVVSSGQDMVSDCGVMISVVLGAGVLNGSALRSGDQMHVPFPDYNLNPENFQGKWETCRDSLSFPVSELTDGNFKYSYTIFDDVSGNKALAEDEMDFKENIFALSEISEMWVEGDELKTLRQREETRLNSRVISFTISPLLSKGPFVNPVLITFKHLQAEGYTTPHCVYWEERLSLWSRSGCSVKEGNRTHTVCACNHMSTFAVAMKKENIDDYSDRQMVVTVAGVLGAVSLLGLVCVAIFIIAIGCYHIESIRIILNLDAALILGHLVFFVGLSNKDNLFYADQNACDVINGFVHFCQVAAFSWLLMEGLHLFSMFQPLINEKNSSSLMMYLALGWGIPAAFAGACAGYPYDNYGIPMKSEFCWMFIRDSGAWYFGAPVLALVLLNVAVRGLVLFKVLTWKGDAIDDKLEKAKRGLVFSSVLLFVVGMTWLMGVKAVNNTTTKVNHYFFLLFYTLQGLLIFVFYCVKNKEMWEVYREKKEQKEKEANAVHHFVYIP